MAQLVNDVWRPSRNDIYRPIEFQAATRVAGPFKQLGAEGLDLWAGYVQESYSSRLYWPGAYSIYDEMRRRDPSLRSLVSAVRLLARQAKLRITPATDQDADREVAEFVESALDDMSHTVDNWLDDVFTMIPFGWSWSVVHYKRRLGRSGKPPHRSRFDDGRVGWRKWMFVRQSSYHRWETDEQGGLQALVQQPAPTYEEFTLPLVDERNMQRGLHFVADRDGGNPEGLSVFESVYEPWYFLKNYQIIQGIGWQRTFVGLPVFRYREGVRPASGDKTAVEAMGEGLVVDERQWVSVPPSIEFSLESTDNTGASALLETIKYTRQLMLSTVLADFIALGSQSVGSWALGRDKSELFIMAVNGWLAKIAEVLTRFAIPGLLDFNEFPGMTDFPVAEFTTIRKPDLTQLSQFIATISNHIPLTDEDVIWLRQEAQMPDIRPEELEEAAPAPKHPDTGAGVEEVEAGEVEPSEVELAEDPPDKDERDKLEREIEKELLAFWKEEVVPEILAEAEQERLQRSALSELAGNGHLEEPVGT